MAKSNFDKCMGGGKAEMLDSLIKVEDKEVVSIWDEFGKANPTVVNNLINNIKKRGDK